VCEQRQQFSSVSSANSVSSASSKSVNRASNTQQQQRFATCSPVSRRNHHCHDHLQISLERIFRRSSLIRFLRFTGQLQLCGCIVQYLSQCSSVVFFPDPVADVCRFKGLGLRASNARCACVSRMRLHRLHIRPASFFWLLWFVPSQMYWDGIRVQPCVLLVVAIMGLLQFFGCPCILLVFVHTHLLSGPAADMRCGPQPKGSPQQRQVY
jgi:hypothetical protein